MADEKKSEEAPKAKAAAPAPLADAGSSSDPLVHQALGELEIAERNRDALNVSDEVKKAADEQVKAAQAKLKDLGVAL